MNFLPAGTRKRLIGTVSRSIIGAKIFAYFHNQNLTLIEVDEIERALKVIASQAVDKRFFLFPSNEDKTVDQEAIFECVYEKLKLLFVNNSGNSKDLHSIFPIVSSKVSEFIQYFRTTADNEVVNCWRYFKAKKRNGFVEVEYIEEKDQPYGNNDDRIIYKEDDFDFDNDNDEPKIKTSKKVIINYSILSHQERLLDSPQERTIIEGLLKGCVAEHPEWKIVTHPCGLPILQLSYTMTSQVLALGLHTMDIAFILDDEYGYITSEEIFPLLFSIAH